MTSTGTQPLKVLQKSGSYPNIASMHAEQSSTVNAKGHSRNPTKRELKPQPPPRLHKTPPPERESQTVTKNNKPDKPGSTKNQ